MISRVLLNLIRNAAQALENSVNPTISIRAFHDSIDRVIISVTDNGPGISPDISEEIFMPFFTTRTKGSGVGLSYSRQIMNMHKGIIDFDSYPGSTEFRLEFSY